MPNYQNAKVYKLVGNGKIYIGSTTQKLCKRKASHITSYKLNSQCTSREIVSDPNHYIELIENVSCNSKEELFIRERYWIENTNCINKCVPCRTVEEVKERKRQYYHSNKDKLLEEKKQYRENNKDKLLQQKKEYYQANKDKILEKTKKRYQEKKAQSNNIINA